MPRPPGQWYNLMVLYTRVPRCPICGLRATLDRSGADALVRVSDGQLEAYECTIGEGWHLRRPGSEPAGPVT
ncbi:MAG TPA: hypothetical protein VFX70_07180 [Mycobacteriales bacterium]|nr:hypothetical protein [Mycobacteriales bacterium]